MTQPIVQFAFVVYLQLLICNTYTACIHSQAVLTTDKRCYAKNESIVFSWHYRSDTEIGNFNQDVLSIFYYQTIPTGATQRTDSQMFVYVSALSRITYDTTIRNNGSVVFDGNPPIETNFQTWPLKEGYYKSYILGGRANYIYTSSEAFVVGTCIQTNKVTYQYNEPILIHWNYNSSYTIPRRPGIFLTNYDFVAIYNSNEVKPENWIMLVAVSTLTQDYNSTIRNNGVVIFDGKSPNETGSQKWPLQVGEYDARVFDITRNIRYASSDTFTVLAPPTKSPTAAPMKAPVPISIPVPALNPIPMPIPVPVKVPVPLPVPVVTLVPVVMEPTDAPQTQPDDNCGLFGLSIFCPFTFCGIIGRLFGLC